MKLFNLIVAGATFVAYMYYGIRYEEWRKSWYVLILSVLNLWAAVYLN